MAKPRPDSPKGAPAEPSSMSTAQESPTETPTPPTSQPETAAPRSVDSELRRLAENCRAAQAAYDRAASEEAAATEAADIATRRFRAAGVDLQNAKDNLLRFVSK